MELDRELIQHVFDEWAESNIIYPNLSKTDGDYDDSGIGELFSVFFAGLKIGASFKDVTDVKYFNERDTGRAVLVHASGKVTIGDLDYSGIEEEFYFSDEESDNLDIVKFLRF